MSKTALITGAAQGIGKAIALNMARKGFQLAIADLPQQKDKAEEVLKEIQAIRPNNKPPIFLPVDVSNQKSVFDVVDESAAHFGAFDVMVNNAGIATVSKVLEATPEELERVMRINVGGVLYGTQAAARKLVELNRGGDFTPSTVKTAKHKLTGKIINCCSITGNEAFASLPLYSSSKFAVKGLTQASAKELAPLGITVNAYAPGIVLTPMWDLIDTKLAEITGLPLGENLKRQIDGIALKRGETAEDVSGLVAFLAGEESNYITGQNISVDGGISYN
ncbi:LANO_0C03026g1_1 [Lachancea nothofagi CBS 11611]|uniref:LANO_0C03026g1_1 n=1 Tax=Lachancea nothofagi CBS 11611 TaxID=1266666 RepID=A0A1G4J5N7_9SACH|nr:LANO_0C03026g1_1 [Lachancea nothofagi CBS 11611]